MEDSFGAYLKNQRELRGISLEDIANATRIPMKHLEALEEDRYDDLPGEVFIKGYIRGYGEALGADVDDLLSAYDERIGRIRRQEREKTWNEAAREELKKSSLKTQAKLVALVAALAAVGWGLWSTLTGKPEPAPQEAHIPQGQPQPPKNFEVAEPQAGVTPEPAGTPEGQQAPTSGSGANSGSQKPGTPPGIPGTGMKEETGPQESGGPQPQAAAPKKKQIAAKPGTGFSGTPSATAPENKISQSENGGIMNDLQDQTVPANRAVSGQEESENSETFSLEIRASEVAWFHMIVDQQEEKDFTLKSGERIVLHARDQILADIGNREGSEFLLNGKKFELPGTRNVIHNFVFKPDLVE